MDEAWRAADAFAGSDYTRSRFVAMQAMVRAAEMVSVSAGDFGAWTAAATGASFALILGNLTGLTKLVNENSLHWCLRWFAFGMALGVVQAFCRVWVSVFAASVKASIESGMSNDAAAVDIYKSSAKAAIFPHMRWYANWKEKKWGAGDPLSIGRSALRWLRSKVIAS